jgi:hypothetical protein
VVVVVVVVMTTTMTNLSFGGSWYFLKLLISFHQLPCFFLVYSPEGMIPEPSVTSNKAAGIHSTHISWLKSVKTISWKNKRPTVGTCTSFELPFQTVSPKKIKRNKFFRIDPAELYIPPTERDILFDWWLFLDHLSTLEPRLPSFATWLKPKNLGK